MPLQGKKNTDEHMVGIHVMSGVSWSFYDLPCDPFFGASNARDGRSNFHDGLHETW